MIESISPDSSAEETDLRKVSLKHSVSYHLYYVIVYISWISIAH